METNATSCTIIFSCIDWENIASYGYNSDQCGSYHDNIGYWGPCTSAPTISIDMLVKAVAHKSVISILFRILNKSPVDERDLSDPYILLQ